MFQRAPNEGEGAQSIPNNYNSTMGISSSTPSTGHSDDGDDEIVCIQSSKESVIVRLGSKYCKDKISWGNLPPNILQ